MKGNEKTTCVRDLLTHGREEPALVKLYLGGRGRGKIEEKYRKPGGDYIGNKRAGRKG
jgi:hypothetical protein